MKPQPSAVASIPLTPVADYIAESRFGKWFLRSSTWQRHVLRVAVDDLKGLLSAPLPTRLVVLDVGCGEGQAFQVLEEAFHPERIIGIDLCDEALDRARLTAQNLSTPVTLEHCNCSALSLSDESVDMVFCHQTLHHLVDQESALAEFHRVLKPGGALLLAESTEEYIRSWVIRLLFRHPMDVQKSADAYLRMLGEHGFVFESENVSFPYLWWSRTRDFGLFERFALRTPPPPGVRRETLVNVAAAKRRFQAQS